MQSLGVPEGLHRCGHVHCRRGMYGITLVDLHRVSGLDRLKLIHLNDSKTTLGTRVDRHAHIGQGYLGLEAGL